MRGDAHRAGDLEDDLAGLGGQVQRVQHRGAGEVDVGQPARAIGDEGGEGLDPTPQPDRAPPPPQGLEDDVGPRVAVGVEEVAEPGHHAALAERPAHEDGRVDAVDQQGVGGHGGGAVERTGHGGIRGREAVVQARAGRCGDPGRDRRGREAVVEQGDEQDPQQLDVGTGVG